MDVITTAYKNAMHCTVNEFSTRASPRYFLERVTRINRRLNQMVCV